MTDLFELLDHAAGAEPAADPRRVEADVVRGRRALRRRRLIGATAGIAAAASVAVVTTVAVTALPVGTRVAPGTGTAAATSAGAAATDAGTGAASSGGTSASTTSPPAPPGPSSPDTVSTTGSGSEKDLQTPQPPPLVAMAYPLGLTLLPGLTPEGWRVDGDRTVTTFNPPGVTGPPDETLGKFTVMLMTSPPEGYRVRAIAEVDGVTYYGWVNDNPHFLQLGLRLEDGRYLQFTSMVPDLSVGSGYAVRLLLAIIVTQDAPAHTP